MTPAPISVERFKLTLVGDINGLLGPFPAVKASPQGEYVRHSDYAALLHQLAEREADVDFVRGCLRSRGEYIEGQPPLPLAVVAYDHMWKRAEAAESKLAERDAAYARLYEMKNDYCDRLEAAECAREDALSELRNVSRYLDPRQYGEACKRIAAFLAASGGKDNG